MFRVENPGRGGKVRLARKSLLQRKLAHSEPRTGLGQVCSKVVGQSRLTQEKYSGDPFRVSFLFVNFKVTKRSISMEKKKFNVLTWDFNQDKLEHYDVLPYLRNCYKERQERSKRSEDNRYTHVPETLEEFKQFVEDESRYQFWARCEYEIILHSWPPRKDGNEHKLDVHEQIMMNRDLVAEILYQEFNGKKKI